MTVAKEKYTDLNNGRGMFKGVTNKRTAAIILLSFMFLSLFSIILSSQIASSHINSTQNIQQQHSINPLQSAENPYLIEEFESSMTFEVKSYEFLDFTIVWGEGDYCEVYQYPEGEQRTYDHVIFGSFVSSSLEYVSIRLNTKKPGPYILQIIVRNGTDIEIDESYSLTIKAESDPIMTIFLVMISIAAVSGISYVTGKVVIPYMRKRRNTDYYGIHPDRNETGVENESHYLSTCDVTAVLFYDIGRKQFLADKNFKSFQGYDAYQSLKNSLLSTIKNTLEPKNFTVLIEKRLVHVYIDTVRHFPVLILLVAENELSDSFYQEYQDLLWEFSEAKSNGQGFDSEYLMRILTFNLHLERSYEYNFSESFRFETLLNTMNERELKELFTNENVEEGIAEDFKTLPLEKLRKALKAMRNAIELFEEDDDDFNFD